MTRSRVLLLVEDNPDDIELTLRAFGQVQFDGEVVVVHDGQEALDYLFADGAHAAREPDRMPAVVLLDLKLPKIDGLEVLRRMRLDPRTRRVPVVVLTSSDEHHDIGTSYDLGANSFVRKPVDFSRFVDTGRQLGQYWLAVNEPPPRRLGG